MEKPARFRFVISLLWTGFLLAISFMEAPLKFQAELVTLPIGLSVGRVIFATLNKVEWVLLALIVLSEIFNRFQHGTPGWTVVLLAILLFQSFWLLPELDARAVRIIEGELIPPSNTHFYYVAFEVVKLTALVLYTRLALKGFAARHGPLKVSTT